MIKKLFMLLLGGMIISSISLASDTQIKLPKMEVLESQIQYLDQNYVIGNMKIKNNTDAYFPNVYYNLSLSNKVESGNGSNINGIFNRNKNVKFAIGPNQEKNVSFFYKMPKHLPQKVEGIRVQFSTRTMDSLDDGYLINLNQNIGRNNDFIDIKQGLWEINKKELRGDIGPELDSKTKAVAKFNLKSNFNKDMVIKPKINIYQRLDTYNEGPIFSKIGDEIKIKSKEEKNIKIDIPVMTKSDSYLIRIEFVNDLDEVISNEEYFRYVVKGENAKILETFVTQNEEGKILNTFISGPADTTTKLDNIEVHYIIKTLEDEVLEEKSFNTNVFNTLKRLQINLNEFVGNIKIEIDLKKNEEIYDVCNFNINVDDLNSNDLEFLDIKSSNIRDAVNILNSMGIINGYPDGTFKPDNNITRAEFTAIAIKLAGAKITSKSNSKFKDVVEEHWAKDYINLAQDLGYIQGYGDGNFKPDNNVTIAESLTILVNILGNKDAVMKTELYWPKNYIKVANDMRLNEDTIYESYMDLATRGSVSIMTKNALFYKLIKGGL